MSVEAFEAAWRSRDLQQLASSMASDVVLRSPVMTSPFEGRDAAVELYGVLFEVFGQFEVTNRFEGDGEEALFWRAEVGGRRIQGVDLLRFDEQGRIREATVMIRPLVDIAVFAVAVGPRLAAKRGPLQALALRLANLPLRLLLGAVDLVAPRLVQR